MKYSQCTEGYIYDVVRTQLKTNSFVQEKTKKDFIDKKIKISKNLTRSKNQI